VKVKLLTGMAGADRSWSPGDQFECDPAEAARLIEAGVAEAIAAPIERATRPAPAAKRGK
jgi:hypothetical protein